MWLYSWASGHLEVVLGRRAGELERVVVVVEDEVAVQPPRQAVRLRRLAAVGSGVAEEGAADLVEIDIGLAVSAALAAVGLRVAPAELAVLDRVDVFGDGLDTLDVVGDAVAVGVAELGRVEALRHPVHAEVRRTGGRARRLGHACRRCGWGRGDRSAAPRAARNAHWSPARAEAGASESIATEASEAPISRQRARTRGNLQTGEALPGRLGGDTSGVTSRIAACA